MGSLREGGIIAGKYRLERVLGRGGMGAVWAARHVELDTAVAIKLMVSSHAASDDSRARFKREAKAAAQLRSPHIAEVRDYGVEGDAPYLVMELLEGEDLGARLKREGRLSLAAAAQIITPLCKGLRRAHEAGIVHRDLKPANIFLARQDDEVVVKIVDFGLAKALAEGPSGGQTESGVILGTPYYMSPEQVRDSKRIDPRSDLWSAGVIAYRCLTGVLPFTGEGLPAVLMSVCTGPIPVPSRIAPDLSPAVDRFFERALARDVSLRFQDAREFGESFAALLGVPPPDWSSAPVRHDANVITPHRRRILLWALAASGVILLTLGIFGPLGVLGTYAGLDAILLAPALARRPGSLLRRMFFALAGVLAAYGAVVWFNAILLNRAAQAVNVAGAHAVLLALTLLSRRGAATTKVRLVILGVGITLTSIVAIMSGADRGAP
jgi:serine/threonine protein kinase